MKINLDLDTTEVASKIAEEVVKALSPLLKKSREEDNHLFSVDTLAEYLGISKQCVRDRVKHKQIPHLKVGKLLKFRKREIDRWLDTLKVPTVNPYSGKLTRLK